MAWKEDKNKKERGDLDEPGSEVEHVGVACPHAACDTSGPCY